MKLFPTFAVLLAMACCGTAHAFCFPPPPPTNEAAPAEYYDAATDRYYLAWWSPSFVGGCYSGVFQFAPEGTTRTALGWTTVAHAYACGFVMGPDSPACSMVRRVCEFEVEGQPAPASRFYTIDVPECEALKRPGSGWTYLPMTTLGETGGPSLSAFEVDATGACRPGLVPVYRFLKTSGRGPLNHRFVADPQVVEQMRARAGWTFERIAFCVLGAQRNSLGTVSPGFQEFQSVGPLAHCHNGQGRNDTCIESDNMPALRNLRSVSGEDPEFASRTGAFYSSGYAYTLPVPSQEAAVHSFAQTSGLAPGAAFFVTSIDRIAGSVSSLRGRTEVVSGQIAPPFLAGYEVEMDLVLDYRLFVKRARVAGDGGAAYVQPLVTLRDQRSGLAMALSPGAIATLSPIADGTFRDAATGDATVFIALGAATSIGRSLGLPALSIPKTFDADNPWGMGGDFEYRINRSEFARALERARALEPRLSADPGDYRVEALSLKGEVAGDAEIGYQVERMELSVLRP
jgi:hypothetical protein